MGKSKTYKETKSTKKENERQMEEPGDMRNQDRIHGPARNRIKTRLK